MDFKKGLKIGAGFVLVQCIVGFISAVTMELMRRVLARTSKPKPEVPEE